MSSRLSHPHYRSAGPVMPHYPYDREFLRHHVYEYTGVHVKEDAHAEPIERRIVEWMLKLPAWVQVLLVENRVRFEIGAAKKIGIPRNAIATADPEAYHIRHKIKDMSELEADLSHEVGHIIDAIIADAQPMGHKVGQNGKQPSMWSEEDSRFRRAMSHDRDLPCKRRKSDWRYVLKTHLASKIYKPAMYPEESFAMLFERYLMEHVKGKSEIQINDEMDVAFPKMWAQMRDRFMPMALDLASEQYSRRQNMHDRLYARRHEAIAEALETAGQVRGFCVAGTDDIVAMMAASQQSEQWQERLEALALPKLPKDPYKLLTLMFPVRFEDEAQVKEYLNHDPALKTVARRSAMTLEDTIARDGLHGFIKAVHQLELAFAQSEIEQSKGASRTS